MIFIRRFAPLLRQCSCRFCVLLASHVPSSTVAFCIIFDAYCVAHLYVTIHRVRCYPKNLQHKLVETSGKMLPFLRRILTIQMLNRTVLEWNRFVHCSALPVINNAEYPSPVKKHVFFSDSKLQGIGWEANKDNGHMINDYVRKISQTDNALAFGEQTSCIGIVDRIRPFAIAIVILVGDEIVVLT